MTYRIHAELGKRTDTMFADGKILEKTTFSHLEKRPQRFNSLLHSIQSSHQKEAFKVFVVDSEVKIFEHQLNNHVSKYVCHPRSNGAT